MYRQYKIIVKIDRQNTDYTVYRHIDSKLQWTSNLLTEQHYIISIYNMLQTINTF